MIHSKRAQVSVDWIIMFAFLLILLLFMFVTVRDRDAEMISTSTKLYAKAVSDKVAGEINAVYLAGDGTSKTVGLPATLKDGTVYTVIIYPEARKVEIRWIYRNQTMHYSSPMLSKNLAGNLTRISNDISISNSKGVITIIKNG